MTILMMLIPLSIVLLSVAGWAFLWAVNNGQFEKLDKHAVDVLLDEQEEKKP